MIDINLDAEDFELELEKVKILNEQKKQERVAGQSKERLDAFLQELTSLCEKYDIYIKGCGCCGSPWLEDFKTRKRYDNLTITERGYETDE